MFKILQQLQNQLKEISILVSVPTDDWIKGYISYIDEDCISLEAEEREGVYYTIIIKLDCIVAVEFVSDIRLSKYDRITPLELKDDIYFLDDEGPDEINN